MGKASKVLRRAERQKAQGDAYSVPPAYKQDSVTTPQERNNTPRSNNNNNNNNNSSRYPNKNNYTEQQRRGGGGGGGDRGRTNHAEERRGGFRTHSRSTHSSQTRNDGPQKNGYPQSKSFSSGSQKHKTSASKTEKKVKKPKHLKRKLEDVLTSESGHNVENDKEKILREMKEWEEKKQMYQAFSLEQHTKKEPMQEKRNKGTSIGAGLPNPKRQRADHSIAGDSQEPQNVKAEQNKPEVDQRGAEGGPTSEKIRNTPENTEQKAPEKNERKAPKKTERKAPEKTDLEESDLKQNIGNPPSRGNDSGSDVDSVQRVPEKRERGRRRRGRQDTNKPKKETANDPIETNAVTDDAKTKPAPTSPVDATKETSPMSVEPQSSQESTTTEARRRKNTQAEGLERYCLGRKPVTDFAIGQVCTGKVVYMKPFGVFFDIGCHSDAFCHVSRLQDEYVESPESLFKEGDTVSNIHVVEIDRRQKRITVSLQSAAMIEREKASLEFRKERKELPEKQANSTKKSARGPSHSSTNPSHVKFSENDDAPSNNKRAGDKQTGSKPKETQFEKPTKPESEMDPAELKRAQKLARRAARRAAAENSNEGDDPDQNE